MTYAYGALDHVAQDSGNIIGYSAVVVGFAVLALGSGAATLRRRTT